METKKMTLANVQGKLSRAEMKNVMAGNELTVPGLYSCESACVDDDSCNNGKKCKEASCPDDPSQKMYRCLAS
jgi:hypothetical protein